MQFIEAIKAIKDRLSLVDIAGRYVRLRRNGPRFVAPCPFHQETKPSFSINEDKGLYYCFGCQAAGDLIDFYAKINGLDFRESVAQLAEEAGITIDAPSSPQAVAREKQARTEKQAMLAMHRDAGQHFAANLRNDKNPECRDYIGKRGLAKDIVEHFELGWASREWHALEHFLTRRGHDAQIAAKCGLLGIGKTGAPYDRFRGRLMFPIKNLSGQIIAFGGRIIADEDEAKYINSADTPIYGKKEHLYGLPQARRGISARGFALLTEGYMDVLALHQFGYDNSIGVLGTALTDEQIHRLSGFTSHIGLLFDGDKPGRKAALRAAELLLCRGLACSVILLPESEDIDSLLRGAGPEAFENLRTTAPDGLTFCLNIIQEFAPREALAWARNFLANMRLPELVGRYAALLAQRLGIAEAELRSTLAPRSRPGQQPVARPELICNRDDQILMFAIRYPERLDDLRELGADLALTRQDSRVFWQLLETCPATELEYHLDEKQKKFWLEHRGPQAPPRDNAEFELACLRDDLARHYAKAQAAAMQAALACGAGRDFTADLQYLQALRDAMRKHNEQS